MKVTNIFKPLTNLWTYYGYYRKVRKIQADFNEFVAEWDRIGGFKASTKQLLDLLDKHSLILVEYATWTPIEWDDAIAKMIRTVLVEYRATIINMINWARQGHEPSPEELQGIAGQAGADEYGSPMTVLYILTTLFQALQWLKLLQADKQGLPKPDNDPPPAPKRPIINFIRKRFSKS